MTDKEIIQALRCCKKEVCADGGLCPLFSDADCIVHLCGAVTDLIERLTAENVILPDGQASAIESLRKEIEWKDMVIAIAQRKQAEAEAERDALLEKVPQWISVEERLPIDRLKKYLVAFRDAGGPIVDMARYFPSDGWTCDNWDVPQKLITHWMPLPEAPKFADVLRGAPEAPEEGEKA